MPICVHNEIQPLRKVLLHRPGQELEHLLPDSMERLLFDDIPYLEGAQREHDLFAQSLRDRGVEVVYLDRLTAETLAQSKTLKKQFVERFIAQGGDAARYYRDALYNYLMEIPTELELVQKTMAGVTVDELKLRRRNALASMLQSDEHFVLDPIPNLYFTRDPFASIGRGASINRMYSVTRNRETIYARTILAWHPDYAGQVPLYYTPEEAFSLEGGDILNLSEQVLAVGVSQRTKPEAVEQLALHIFADKQSEVDTVLAIEIPSMRAFMHLDTVLTQVDRDVFVAHPAILDSLRIFSLKPDGTDLKVRELNQPIQRVLADALGLEQLRLLHCGGVNPVAAAREQWNDASNTLCISPGTVITYERNNVTNAILADNGVEVIPIAGSELSRGRGGPRCMSMPLLRQQEGQTKSTTATEEEAG